MNGSLSSRESHLLETLSSTFDGQNSPGKAGRLICVSNLVKTRVSSLGKEIQKHGGSPPKSSALEFRKWLKLEPTGFGSYNR